MTLANNLILIVFGFINYVLVYPVISLTCKQTSKIAKQTRGLNLVDSLNYCTCHQISLALSSDSYRCKHRPPSSIALTQSRQATLSFSDDFKGCIRKLATFIVKMTYVFI